MATPIQQLLSRSIFATDGTTTVWDFSFSGGYLDRTHIKAFVLTPEGGQTDLVLNYDTQLIGPYQLLISPALTEGDELHIYRDTPKNLPLVDFTDGAVNSEIALDTNAKQAVFIAAESTDLVSLVRPVDLAVSVATSISAAASATAASASATASATAAGVARDEAVAASLSPTTDDKVNTAPSGLWSTVRGFIAYLTGALGASIVGFTQAGTGARTRPALDKIREVMSPTDYAEATSLNTALAQIEDNSSTGTGVDIPAGDFYFAGNLILDKDRMNLSGAGRHATMLRYDLAAAGPAITVNNPAVGGYNQGRLSDIAFRSNNTTTKTFLDLYNVANYQVERIATNTSLWQGVDSIGIRVRGRQFVNITNCEIGCDRPIVFSPNAVFPSLAMDHFKTEQCELVGNSATRPVIEIESGVSFANTTFRDLALVKGKHGIFWDDTTSTAASFGLKFEDVRTEQGLDPTGYSFYLASTAQNLQDVRFNNCRCDLNRNGIYLRNAQNIVFDQTGFYGGAGRTAWDVTLVPGSVFEVRNCYVQTGATMTVTNGRRVSQMIDTTTNIRSELWVYSSGTPASFREGTVETGTYTAGQQLVVGAGAVVELCDPVFLGFVTVGFKAGAVGAYYFLRGSANVSHLVFGSNAGWFGITAGAANINIYHNGTAYVIQNNTGSSQTLRIWRQGCNL